MRVVTGVFHTVESAEAAIQSLLDAGFTDDDIGVITRDTKKGPTIADDLGREYASGATPREAKVMSRSTVWDRLPDGYDEIMRRDGVPEDGVRWYHARSDANDVLLVVDGHDRAGDVMQIMRDRGGELYHGTAATREAVPHEEVGREYRAPVLEEEVSLEKTRREVGEVHITSETTRRDVDVPTVVTHEEIRVERRALDRPISPEEYKGRKLEEGGVCMPIVEEEIRVVKRPVIREELVVTRVPVTEQKTVKETVTRTEPHIEKRGKVDRPQKGKEAA